MKRLIAIASLATALCLPLAVKAQTSFDLLSTTQDEDQLFVALALPADDGSTLFAEVQGQQPPPSPQGEVAPPPQQGPMEQRGQHMGMMGKGPGEMRQSLDAKMAVLDPAKFAELQKLREQELAIVKDFLAKEKAERDEFKKLVDDYKANPTDELKAKIREKIAARFDTQQKIKETRIEAVSKKLEDAKKDKNTTVDKVLDRIISAKEQPKGERFGMKMKGHGGKDDGKPAPPPENN